MAITFIPDQGQILMCDFTSGFARAEMQKIRHCIVVSPRRRAGTCIVVPLSLQPPDVIEQWHYILPKDVYPCIECGSDVWAKGDMITHVALTRLSRPLENHREVRAVLKPEHLKEILKTVVHSISCGHIAQHV
jgi:uncharacterized protein YifN (PemK superfamily)